MSVLVQVGAVRDIVGLVAVIALQFAKIDDFARLDDVVLGGVPTFHQIDPGVRSLRGLELGQPQHQLAIGGLINRHRAGSRVSQALPRGASVEQGGVLSQSRDHSEAQ